MGEEIALALDAGSDAAGNAFDARQASRRLLDGLLYRASGDGGRLQRTLLEVHRELCGGAGSRWTESVRGDLVAAVQAGRLVLTRRPARVVAVVPVDPGSESDVLGPPSSSTLDWLEIKVVDSDGKHVPDVLYTVTTADGSTQQGQVDKKGFARLEGLKSGTCTVSFPEVDRAEIQAM